MRLTSRWVANSASGEMNVTVPFRSSSDARANIHRLPDVDTIHIALFQDSADPDVVEIDHRHDRIARPHDLAGRGDPYGHDARDRSDNSGVAKAGFESRNDGLFLLE